MSKANQPRGRQRRREAAYRRGYEAGRRAALFGPYAHLNGNRHLSEDEWVVEDNPIENTEEHFSIPLYSTVEPSFPSASARQEGSE